MSTDLEKSSSNCYLCGIDSISERKGSVRDDAKLKIYECNNCGLVFLSSNAHICNSFYEKDKMFEGFEESQSNIKKLINKHDWENERRYQFCEPMLRDKSVLDFGCGAAGFLMKAKQVARLTEGIELNKSYTSYYKEKGLKVYSTIAEANKRIANRKNIYDVITAFHVIEHLIDPRKDLSLFQPILSKDGQIIVEVPSADDPLLTLYDNEAFSHFTYWSAHLYLFNTETLKKLATQAGLKINFIRQIQNYPLSNHLYWLAHNKPGGHEKWSFLNDPALHAAYEKQLSSIGKCDTIIASFSF